MTTNQKIENLINNLKENKTDTMEVVYSDVEVGGTYPLYGRITRVFDTTPQGTLVEINNSILLAVRLDTKEQVERLKERAFELGLFVTEITATEPRVEGDCVRMVFGPLAEHSA